MNKYILIFCLITLVLGCVDKTTKQPSVIKIEKLQKGKINHFLYYAVEITTDNMQQYATIIVGKQLVQLLDSNLLDSPLVIEGKAILKANGRQFEGKYKVNLDIVDSISNINSKQDFLNIYTPKGYINPEFDNEVRNAIIHVAIRKWKLTCLKDDETGFIVIMK